MRAHYALLSTLLLTTTVSAQLSFTNASSRKSTETASGGCMGVVDMNGDGLDDLAILHNSRTFQVDYQNVDGSFTLVDYGQVSNAGQWGWAIADIDNDGHKDMVCGGNSDGTHYVRISARGVSQLSDLGGSRIYQQGMSIADIDNDGLLDVLACNDVGPNKLWFSNASGELVENSSYIDWATTPSSDMSGNYGSCFTDFDSDGDLDLYLAKCRQGVNNRDDPRRWNRLFVNDGSNAYSDQAAGLGVQIRNQTWTADFGDFDNDGDLDMVATNHDATIQLFENVDNTSFVDVTAGSGVEFNGLFLQSKFVDFDNDGYLDLLIAGGAEFLFMGNGDGTFTRVTGLFPSSRAMHSFATGDLNNDGFQDVFANYGTAYVNADPSRPDRLWLNDGNDNHWLSVRLRGTISNRDAVGAQVRITGPWGTQVREVKAGESYGMVTSFACSFGLGTDTIVPTLTVRWPSGLVETFNDIGVDRTITIVENTCISPVVEITTEGAPFVCTGGDALTLTANDGFSYRWSTGDTTRSIDVSEGGSYSVTLDDGNGCVANGGIHVRQDPDETPTVSVAGDAVSCEGAEVVLTSSSASTYEWSNGAGTTQEVTVTTTGSYTVTVQGACSLFTSAPVQLTFLDAPDAPLSDDVSIPFNSSATLFALGDGLAWFDVPVGGAAIGTGNTYITPVLNDPATYWVEASTTHGGETARGGAVDRSGSGQYHTNADYYQIFNAFEDMVIRSVKVYANAEGERAIAVVDQETGEVIVSGTFNIPTGESRVTLDFSVPAGGPYGLRCVGGNPGLWRDGTGSVQNYPYALGTLGSITRSSASGNGGTTNYYFFYDIEVATPSIVCAGPRTAVNVHIGSTAIPGSIAATGFSAWPNPTDGFVTLAMDGIAGRATLQVLDLAGRLVYTTDLSRMTQGTAVVDLNGLAAGDYTLAVRHAEGRDVTRLVVR